MKIVTICEEGNNRSVHCAWLLKYRNHEVIPIGINRHSAETFEMLFNWADRIILVDARWKFKIPQGYHSKLLIWDVGDDTYEHHWNPDLLANLKVYLAESEL